MFKNLTYTVYEILPKNKIGILQIFLTGVVGFIGLYFVSFFLMFYPYDFYADYLKIPNNIELNIPKGETFGNTESIEQKPNKIPKNKDFELYNSFQPGLYTYDIWLSKIDSGKIFLKVYEITKNDRLSESRLIKRSEIIVEHSNDSLQKYSAKYHFTIYEGDWGKPYAARFEVWYKK
ncbi:hypothetical protein GO491_11670 [Flavobacteriaceae bacterium Ap0902]|nr:hypothetical protein [Flavobacteriaceae bacterium Ap0902]